MTRPRPVVFSWVVVLSCAGVCAAASVSAASTPKASAPSAATEAGRPPAPATPAEPADLTQAVAAMRRIKPSDLSKEKQEAKGKELGAAWETLIGAGKAGADALKAELAKIEAAKEKDDFFKLGTGALLWQIGRLDEAPAIAAAWAGDVDLALNFNYVFYVAFEAALTQDPRALPLMKSVLRDNKGSVFRPQHALNISWPGTHSFIWSAYGPKGLPELNQVLQTSADPTALESAIVVLTTAQYLPALPRVRQLAAEGQGGVRTRAVWNLGVYGHPQDFDFLVAGLKSKDPKEAFDFAFALYEYGDLRAVAHLVPLLESGDASLRQEVRLCLAHLLTPEGLAALHRFSTQAPTDEERQAAANFVAGVLEKSGLTWKRYTAMTLAQKQEALLPVRERHEEEFRVRPGDRTLTHDELLEAAEEWKKNGRITGGSYEWVESRQALAASSSADIDLWLDVKAKVCLRLSDECIMEMEIIDELVKRLGRSRYRKDVGLCEKAELIGPSAPVPPAPGAKAPPAPAAG